MIFKEMSGSSTSSSAAAAVYECRIVTNVNICSSSSSSFWLLSPPRIGSVNETKKREKRKSFEDAPLLLLP
jgi:hypothetical protein